jgi:hypothetical protein
LGRASALVRTRWDKGGEISPRTNRTHLVTGHPLATAPQGLQTEVDYCWRLGAIWDGALIDEPVCGFRRLRPGIPIERGHAFRSKAATCSVEGGRGIVAGMIS